MLFFKKIIAQILVWEAKQVLKKYNPKVVVVTGSIGKTSTVTAIESVLKSQVSVRRSQDDKNDIIGIALTILGLKRHNKNPFMWLVTIIEGLFISLYSVAFPQWLIIEIGAYRPRMLEYISSWLTADVVVMTHLGNIPAQIEYFLSTEQLLNERRHLVRTMKNGGTLIINGDDHDLMMITELDTHNVITYGVKQSNTVSAMKEDVIYGFYESSLIEFPQGVRCDISYAGAMHSVDINGALGAHHIYPVLAGFAVGISQNIQPHSITEALKSYQPPRGRMRLLAGIKNSLIIDDSYSSSPQGTEQALSALQNIKVAGRKIVILGDMLHLGTQSIDAHKYIGSLIKGIAQLLVTVGIRARAIADGALDAGVGEGAILQFEKASEVGTLVANAVREGDVILVKGGNLMRMETVVEGLMQHPDQAKNLLVRQHLK